MREKRFSKNGGRILLITLGEEGMLLLEKFKRLSYTHSAREVFDVLEQVTR